MTQDEANLRGRVDVATRALRGLGAALLLASASSFLVQRWDAGNDLLRFGFLLIHSFVLLFAAFFCGGKLGESRSARLFLWTLLAVVPVQFGVLGGLVYSVFALDTPSQLLPSYAVWMAPSATSAVLSALVALTVAGITTWIAARVLARKQARLVTWSLIGLSSLLVVPVRGADWAGLSALVGAVGVLLLERRRFASDYTMRTWEGRLVRGVLWVPVAMLVGRTAVYYPTTDVFLGMLILAAGICATVLARGLESKSQALPVVEWAGSLTVGAGTMMTLVNLDFIDEGGLLLTLGAPAALVVCAQVNRAARAGLERVAAVGAGLLCVFAMFVDENLVSGAASILVGALILGHAILMARPWVGAVGGLLTLAGACLVFDRAVGFESLANWGTLSLLGLLVVMAAAYIERHKATIMSWAGRRNGESTVSG